MPQFIDQDPLGLTTKKGCFNCSKLKMCCPRYTEPKNREGKEIDRFEILTNPDGVPYRFGCCCGDYKFDPEAKNPKEKVTFT